MKRNRLVVIALLAVVLIGIAAYLILKPKPHTVTNVRVGTFSKALSYAPLYVAKHFGWFEADPAFKGINISFREFNDRPAISAALGASELELLFSAEIPAIMCSAQGSSLRILKLSDTAVQKVLVRSDLDIHSPSDLRGKKVAVLQGTSSHYCLLKILRSANLSENDLKLMYMNPNEGRTAFETKQIDGWAVWAPFGEKEEVSGAGREIGTEGALIHSILSVPAPFLTDHSALAMASAQIIQRAKQWIVEHPAEAQSIVAQELGLDIAVVKQAWPKFRWDSQITQEVVNDLQEKADFLAEQEKTRGGRRVDVRSELIVDAYLAK